MSNWLFAVALLLTSLCPASWSQDRHWTVALGGGVTPLLGDISNYFDNSWNLTAGAGFVFNPAFSLSLDYMYNHLAYSQRVMRGTQSRSDSGDVWSLTMDPKLPLRYVGRVRPYLIGGVGYYRRTNRFPDSVFIPSIGNGSFSAIGGSLGLGFDIGLRSNGFGLFGELRYHYASTGNTIVRMAPVTVGLHW